MLAFLRVNSEEENVYENNISKPEKKKNTWVLGKLPPGKLPSERFPPDNSHPQNSHQVKLSLRITPTQDNYHSDNSHSDYSNPENSI